MIVGHRKIAAFSLRRTVGLLNGAAYARAAFEHSTIGYERFSDNGIMNAFTMAITGEPGFAEVQQDVKAIETRRRLLLKSLLHDTARALEHGPGPFIKKLEEVQHLRTESLRSLQGMYQQVSRIDARIAGDMQTAVRVCAGIQLASTIIIAVTPVGLTFAGASTAATAGWIGFGYSVTKSLVKDVSEAKTAGVIAFDVSKDVGKKVGDMKADKVAEKAAENIEARADVISEAEQKIAELSRKVALKVSSKKIAKLNRQIDRAQQTVAESERAIKFAQYGKYAARSLQVVFAAHDIYEGWEDFEKNCNEH